MPVWAWVLIAIGVVALVILVAWRLVTQQRTRRLRERFGPEYERTVTASDSRRDAEAELAAREERRQQFELRPLSPWQRTGIARRGRQCRRSSSKIRRGLSSVQTV